MAYINLDSDKVKVFPSAFRGDGINPESFLTSEGNLTAISSKITNLHKNYVNEDGARLEIVLGGYLFIVAKSDIISQFPNATTIYAGIRIVNLDTSYSGVSIPTLVAISDPITGSNHILDTNDETPKFMGLNFAETDSELSVCSTRIFLLDKSSGTWRVPSASKLKLTTDEIEDVGEENNPLSVSLHTAQTHTDMLYIYNESADINQTWGLSIDDSGSVIRNNCSASAYTARNGYEFIDGIQFYHSGKLKEVTTSTIPEASASVKGLVTTSTQTFGGKKTFNAGIVTNSIENKGSNDLVVTTTNNSDISFVTSGTGVFTYNGDEVVTKNYMASDGVSQWAQRIGNSSSPRTIGSTYLPVYVSYGNIISSGTATYGKRISYALSDVIYERSVNSSSSSRPEQINFTSTADDLVLRDVCYSGVLSDAHSRDGYATGAGHMSFRIANKNGGEFNLSGPCWLRIKLKGNDEEPYIDPVLDDDETLSQMSGIAQVSFSRMNAFDSNNYKLWVYCDGSDVYIGIYGAIQHIESINVSLDGLFRLEWYVD